MAIGLDFSAVSSRAGRLVGTGLRSGIEDLADARATLLTLAAAGRHVVVRTRDRSVVTMDAHVADSETNARYRLTELLALSAGLRIQTIPARDPGHLGPATTVGTAQDRRRDGPTGASRESEPTAPRGLDRPVNCSDATIAIAITLLVPPLVDVANQISTHPAHEVLASHAATLAGFAITFAVIGRFWLIHHRVFELVDDYTYALARVNLLWLFCIVCLPFAASLLSNSPGDEPLIYGISVGTILQIVRQLDIDADVRSGHVTGEGSAGERGPRWPATSRTPTRTPTGTRPEVFARIRRQPRAALTCTDAHGRTSANGFPVPDTEEVTGSIPVSPTTFVPVRGARSTWECAASHTLTATDIPARTPADSGGQRPAAASGSAPAQHVRRSQLTRRSPGREAMTSSVPNRTEEVIAHRGESADASPGRSRSSLAPPTASMMADPVRRLGRAHSRSTLSACGPRSLCRTWYRTRSPSRSDSAPLTTDTCTNRSAPPASGVMKPNPRSAS